MMQWHKTYDLVLFALAILINHVLIYGQSDHNLKEGDQPVLAYKSEAILGEGAFWDHKNNRLFWVDIEAKKVHIYSPEKRENRSFNLPSRVGTVVPMTQSKIVVALEDGVYLLDIDTGRLNSLARIEADSAQNRLNDGKCDANGNLWVGSMNLKGQSPSGALYKVSSNRHLTRMLDSITISNGIVWTEDNLTMYYIDTPTQQIKAYDFNSKTSTISNGRVVVNVDPELGHPDGMAIDKEGKLWVGMWNGSCVARFDPLSGQLMSTIQVPALNVTSCTFGGDDLKTLYITTARTGMTTDELEKFPLSGSLFKVKPGVEGQKLNYFGQ